MKNQEIEEDVKLKAIYDRMIFFGDTFQEASEKWDKLKYLSVQKDDSQARDK